MERLQAAIQKAREQRDSRRAQPEALRLEAPIVVPGDPPEIQTETDVDEAWSSLKEIQLDRPRLRRNRIVTLQADAVSASYDVMRTRLLQQSRVNNWRRIAVVSPHNAGGKTTTAVNLAFSLARHRDIRTIVMDLDLRRCGMSKLLDQKSQVPMGDFLEDRVPFSDIGYRYGQSLAFGLGSGTTITSAEILHSDQTAAMLEKVEAQYAPDFMLFDMPPLQAGDDVLGMLTRVDAAMIVVEAERTSLSQIDVAERQVAELTNVMGLVLNKSRHVSGAYSHDDYY